MTGSGACLHDRVVLYAAWAISAYKPERPTLVALALYLELVAADRPGDVITTFRALEARSDRTRDHPLVGLWHLSEETRERVRSLTGLGTR